ncbi:MAG: signal recognition particle-docking protein FtsY [Clostridiaceae bacterium]|nr:signal recognition particle-docking protein FtsY [Clostridiaceae bacterium]
MAKNKWFGWGKKNETEKQEDTLIQPVEEDQENTIAEENNADTEKTDEDQTTPEIPENIKVGFFGRLKNGLKKTRDSITRRIDEVLVSFGKVDEELFEELEEILITSDMGMTTSLKIIDELREKVKNERIADTKDIREALKKIIASKLTDENTRLKLDTRPSVIVVIGVNGVGKTTSIGKLAHHLKKQGKKITVAAADTFRAAAIDQLEIWTNRAGVDLIKHSEGAAPSAVIYDAIQHCKSKDADVLICDTAGRLHTKKNLMEELRKIFRIIRRELPDADIETLLVLDATTGQNAVSQAKTFSEVSELSGIILTKLDGTAKGGIIVSIKSELNIPVKFIGVGEQMNDLQPFNPSDFVEALFSAQ